MRYSKHIDYLVASIFYLGTQGFWWARTPSKMAHELSLDETKLQAVFDGFPGIFRKSINAVEGGQHAYSLQARYAQKDHKDAPDKQISYIPPLEVDKVRLLYDFVLKSAEEETTRKRALIGNGIAAAAAVISAGAAITAAFVRLTP